MTKIAILSNSYDNIDNLQQALMQIAASQADVLHSCGNPCVPFAIATLGDHFAGPIHIIFDNNDGDGRLRHTLSIGYEQITRLSIPFAEAMLRPITASKIGPSLTQKVTYRIEHEFFTN